MKRRGYTLVKLLVVIAIIAILAAMVAPVLLQAKEASRMRVCASNLHQMGVALSNYFDDHQGHGLPLPPPQYKNPWILCPEPLIGRYVPGSVKALEGELPSYGKRIDSRQQPKRLWICAGDVRRGDADVDKPYWWNCGSSFMYPGPTAYMSGTHSLDRTNIVPRKPMQWRNLKRDILLADYWFDFHSGRRVDHDFYSLTPPTWVSKLQVKGVNVLFLDQHVKACSAAEREEYRKNTQELDNPHFGKPGN